MIRRKLCTLTLAAASVMAASTSAADQPRFEVGGGVNYFSFEQDQINDEFGLRGLLGYRFQNPWGAELVVDTVSTDFSGSDIDFTQYYLQGLYHFNHSGDVQPYLGLGWGQLDSDPKEPPFTGNETTISTIGAGLKWFITNNLALRPSLNYFLATETDDDYATAGLTLSYLWGGSPAKKSAPVAVSQAADADKDGVADNRDQCANTPAGVRVDSLGCPLDTDGDGVYDYLDKCPGTAKKLKVDAQGCPIKLSETVSIDLKINFDSNSDVVKASYYSEIRRVADFLAQYQGTRVVIEGHTDTSGSAAYNKSLSQRRADAVAAVLVEEMNIAPSRVSAIGYGEEQPIADESTREGREANRRVVAKVSATVENLEQK